VGGDGILRDLDKVGVSVRGRGRGRGVKARWLGGFFLCGIAEGVVFLRGWGGMGMMWVRREGCGRWANFCVGVG